MGFGWGGTVVLGFWMGVVIRDGDVFRKSFLKRVLRYYVIAGWRLERMLVLD